MKKYLIIILVLVVGLLAGYYFRDYQYRQEMKKLMIIKSLKLDNQNSQNDPLSLFGKSNPKLEACLKQINPSDLLGLNNETEAQKTQREDCINKYGK